MKTFKILAAVAVMSIVVQGCKSTSNQPPKLTSSNSNGCDYASIQSPEFKLTEANYAQHYFTHSPDGKGFKDSNYYKEIKTESFKLTGVSAKNLNKYSLYLHEGKEYLNLENGILYKLTLPNEVAQVVTTSCSTYWLKKDHFNYSDIARVNGDKLTLSDNVLIYGSNNFSPLEMRPLELENDKFKKTITFKGLEYGGRFFRTWASSETNKLLTPTVQLYARLGFSEWAHLDRAYDESGVRYNVTKINTDTECSQYGCTVYESVGLELPISFLQKNKKGFEIQFEGNQKIVVTVLSYQVEQFLLGIGEYL